MERSRGRAASTLPSALTSALGGVGRVAGRGRQLARMSPTQVAQRVAVRLYRATAAGTLSFPLLDGDVADSATVSRARPPVRPVRGRPLRIGWVMTPPAPGSGGHTTAFRMIEELEAHGHTCTLFLYDRFESDLAARTAIIRSSWPRIRATVRDARRGIDGVDAAVATSWDTAHVLAGAVGDDPDRPAPFWPFYFIQDFEPFFYGQGPEHELALDSYRFGFTAISLGAMIAGLLRDEVGIDSHVVPFGLDSSLYRLDPSTAATTRSGVVFFARPDTPRRGYVLGKLALERFHAQCPDQEIHLFGSTSHDLAVPVTNHGRLTPTQLNALYNRTLAGLALSFTNVSLVPEEMLAAGVVPVCNESRYARMLLTNDEVVWARATPQALADALVEAVRAPDPAARAERAARSTDGKGWEETARTVRAILEDTVYGGTYDSDDADGAGVRSSEGVEGDG